MTYQLHLGDCIEGMRGLPDKSVDCMFSDPPYEREAHAQGRRVSARGGMQTHQSAHWYPVRVKVWLDAIRECRQERGDRAEHETLAPQPVPSLRSLRSRVEALPTWRMIWAGEDNGDYLKRSEVLALLESEGM